MRACTYLFKEKGTEIEEEEKKKRRLMRLAIRRAWPRQDEKDKVDEAFCSDLGATAKLKLK